MPPSDAPLPAASILHRFGALRATPAVIVAGLTIVALLLRLHDLTAQSLWRDEVSSWQQARLDLGGLLAATAADNYPPLHNLLLHLSLSLGDTPFALRLPSAVLGALTVPALYWAGSLLGDRRAAFVAAALLCVSGFHLWYTQEARMYALLGLTTTLYAGAVVRYALRPGRGWAVASVVAGAALLHSHPYGALNWISLTLAAMLLSLGIEGGRRAALKRLAVEALALLLFLPWGLLLLGRARALDATGFWILPASPARVLYYLEQLVTGPFMLGAVALGTVVALLSLLLTTRRSLPNAPAKASGAGARFAFVLIWAALPLALATLTSVLTAPVLYPRYLIGSLPAMLLLIGIGVTVLPGLLRYAALAGVAFAGFTGFIGYGPPDRDDFRDLAAALTAELQPGDCVVMDPLSQIAMSYYARGGFPCITVTAHPGMATFPTAPHRILAIVNPDDGLPDTDTSALGPTTGTKSFGDLSLRLVSPKPVSN